MPQLFRDCVCLWINTVRLDSAIGVARDMRSVTTTAIVGPPFLTAHGPMGVRALLELGVRDAIFDLRLLANSTETWQCVMEAAKHDANGVTVHALAGDKLLTVARTAAEASQQETQKIRRPRVLLNLLPVCISDTAMAKEAGMRVSRAGHAAAAVAACRRTCADGLIVEYADIAPIRKYDSDIPLLAYSQKGASNYAEFTSKGSVPLAGLTEILAQGADHVIVDSAILAKRDVEWAADMLAKELDAAGRKSANDLSSLPCRDDRRRRR